MMFTFARHASFVYDVMFTFARHASLVYDVADRDCQTQNGSTHGHVFMTCKCGFKKKRLLF